jgi:hypothetical protein
VVATIRSLKLSYEASWQLVIIPQNDGSLPAHLRRNYRHIFDAWRKIKRQEGWKTFSEELPKIAPVNPDIPANNPRTGGEVGMLFALVCS